MKYVMSQAKKKVNQFHYRPEVPGGFPGLRDNGPEWW